VLVAAFFSLVDSGLRASLFGFRFLGGYLALRVGFGLLRFALALQLVLAGERAGGFLYLALHALDDAFRASFRAGVFLVVHEILRW
jgi:hypothetical protein